MSGLIELRRVSKAFGATLVLDEVSCELAPGEIVSLLGPSGCGTVSYTHLTLPAKA